MAGDQTPERPKSTPPDLYSPIKTGPDGGTANPAFSHEEPVIVYGRDFKHFPTNQNANHLVFPAKRNAGNEHQQPTVLNAGGGNKSARARSDPRLAMSPMKYATTRAAPNSATPRPKSWQDGNFFFGDVRPASKTVGRQTGHDYIRAVSGSSGGQHHSHQAHHAAAHRHSGRGQGHGRASAHHGGDGGRGEILRVSTGERKENSFSFFDIETDKVSSYQYRPGEEITGVIKLIVRKAVEIRYVELVVTGQGHMSLKRSRDSVTPQTSRETYLYKQTYVIGSGDNAWSSVLTPGHYTSRFRVKLPGHLPSTLHHEDKRHGFKADIAYRLSARVCDDLPKTTGPGQSQYARVRVLLGKKIKFNVQRAFDLSQIPDAMHPVTHREQIFLSCAHTDPAIVTLNLDRAVCLAGDDVRVSLTSELPSSHRVKEVMCSLQEQVALDPKHEPTTFTLAKVIRKDPEHVMEKTELGYSKGGFMSTHTPSPRNQCSLEFTLPTHTELVSPHSLCTCVVSVSYSLVIMIKLSPAGGKLTFKVPIDLGPCAEPIYAEKISSRKIVPLFNRPTRFPCFASHAPPTPSSSSRPESVQSSRSHLVKAEYTNNCFARCFLCCANPQTDD